MRFTLHYEGPQPARGKPDATAKIRDALEPQMRELWTHPPLDDQASDYFLAIGDPHTGNPGPGLFTRHGHTYAALISEAMGLSVELDILLLRPGVPGQAITGGDIDNRIKTLLDALSAPQQLTQVPSAMRATDLANPMHVLLADDKHVTRLNVETERLLAPATPETVHATIRVTTRVVMQTYVNMALVD